jgi:tetratricopeptide (TPR) repeat protein
MKISPSEAFAEAHAHHREGRLQQAAELCAQALEENFRCAEALHLLGVIAGQMGRFNEAAELIGRAIHWEHDVPHFHNDLGVILRKLGQADEAMARYEEALRINPDFVEARHNLANIFRDRGELNEAAAYYRQVVGLASGHAGGWYGLGVCLQAIGQNDEAIEAFRSAIAADPTSISSYRSLSSLFRRKRLLEEGLSCLKRVIELDPGSGVAYNDAGAFCIDLGRPKEAEEYLREALKLAPDSPEVNDNLGKALWAQGHQAEAETCLRKALAINPDHLGALNDLGIVLSDQFRYDESMACFLRALELDPNHAMTHCNLGHAFLLQHRYQEATAYLRRALELEPGLAEAWNNLGGSLYGKARLERQRSDLDEAETCYRQALDIKPQQADFHVNLGLVRMVRGDFEEGFKEYEWRWQTKEFMHHRYERPRWNGEPLEGRTILLHPEGGLGDTIQFVRYAPLVRRRGGRVILRCQPRVRPLLAGCPGVDLLRDDTQDIPWFDVHAPLLSLPGILGSKLETIPAEIPYILPDPDLVARWRARLVNHPGFKVGISWQGNPDFKGDRWRSIPLTAFEPLSKIAGIRLFSLQMGAGREQLSDIADKWRITDLCLPLVEEAAAMMSLDLIVVCDTALAHLAGALGRPVWTAIGYSADWRWFTDRQDTPWYPTMKLFRQPGPGQWQAVLEMMADHLKELLEGRDPSE